VVFVPARCARGCGITAGWLADVLFGDPRRGHPVALFGSAAAAVERLTYADSRTAGALHTGALLAGLAAAGVALTRAGVGGTATAVFVALGGTSLLRTGDAMAALLERARLDVTRNGDTLSVTPPSWRFDIAIEADLIEEIVRLHGYEHIPAHAPRGPLLMLARDEAQRSPWTVRRLLAARDFQEVINYAFIDAAWERDFCGNTAPVRLANPIASQMSVMRTSLIPGLVATLASNLKRQQSRVRVFELGRCFLSDAEGGPVAGYRQPLRLAALAAGPAVPEQWGTVTRRVDFFDLKGDLTALLAPRHAEFVPATHPALHPGRTAEVRVDGVAVGVIGELHPQWTEAYDLGAAPVVFELDLDAALTSPVPAFRELSRFPVVSRDIALIVDQTVAVADLLAAMRRAAPAIVRSIDLFDVYVGKGVDDGKRSLAFRVLMQDTQRTLEDTEVESAISAIIGEADASFGARLRG